SHALPQENCMILQAIRRLPGVDQRSGATSLKGFFIVALTAVGFLAFAQSAHAAAPPIDDIDECAQLGQGATVSKTNRTPMPFDAAQIPGSPILTFATASGGVGALVACQQKVINANPSSPYGVHAYQANFNRSYWDGYGNPFQCVELIDRY